MSAAPASRISTRLPFFDLAFLFLSIWFASLFRFEFELSQIPVFGTTLVSIAWAIAFALVATVGSIYRGRYIVGSLDEMISLSLGAFTSGLVVTFFLIVGESPWGVPRSVIAIAAPLFVLFSALARTIIRQKRLATNAAASASQRAIIFGTRLDADLVIYQLQNSVGAPYRPVAVIGDDEAISNLKIRGVPVAGSLGRFERVVRSFNANTVIIASREISGKKLREIYESSRAEGLEVVVFPSVSTMFGSEPSVRDLRAIQIEDLIDRGASQLDESLARARISGSSVLVTGAGGSIGSELARQIFRFGPKRLVLADRDETLLMNSLKGLSVSGIPDGSSSYLVDIRDRDAVHQMLDTIRPKFVFHAAALKHVGILERFPEEAWKTNVGGTANVLEAAFTFGVEVFVNISTDKAADPTSVLGKTKLLSERMTSWYAVKSGKNYISVRFGNVFGSRGSLIPVLEKQISDGGPITIASPEVTRYFMSIHEACQLVLHGVAVGSPADVLVLEMGEPVNILDLAKRLIDFSGSEVDIVFSGLGPGEKVNEQLFAESEEPIPTSNPRIWKVKSRPLDASQLVMSEWL
jgi:FlaA1/EpsC-like NDP-sugar epimerase